MSLEAIVGIVTVAIVLIGGPWLAVKLSYPPRTPYDDPDFD